MEKGAEQQQRHGTPAIEDLAADRRAHEEHERLHRRYPGYGGRRVGPELVRAVVVLEDADAGDPAEADEEAAPSSCDDEPGFDAAIGVVVGRNNFATLFSVCFWVLLNWT